MKVDPTGDKDSRLRPLPSVGMALLPHELKARRTKRLVFGSIFGGLAVFALLLWLGTSVLPPLWEKLQARFGDPEPPSAAIDAAVAAAVVPSPERETERPTAEALELSRSQPNARYQTLFGTVPSFRGALMAAGLEPDECTQVEQALEHIVDFRRCQPDHKLVVERDEEGALKHFEYHPSATEFVSVSRGENGEFRAEQIHVKVERIPIARANSVETSIGDGLAEIDLPAGLATFFTEAFEGRINFPLQARKGDVFRIIVDEERIDGEFLRYGRIHAVEYDGQKTGKEQAFFYEAPRVPGQFYDATGRAMQGGWLRTPLRYERLSSRYNPQRFHPILKRRVPHLGVDYAAPTGTPVWAAGAGRVVFAGRKGANGNLVIIQHPGGFETMYAHLHRIKSGIRPGKSVKQRELIGFVGSTGRSTGPHLHFGLKKQARYLDPLTELNGPGGRMSSRDLPAFERTVAERKAELAAILDAPAVDESTDEPLVEQVDEIMD